MSPLEAVFIWTAIVLYALVSGLYIFSFIFRREILLNRIGYLIGVPFLFHTAGALARYQAVGNLPTAGPYENSVGATWTIILFTLYIVFRHRPLRFVGVATLPFSLMLLGYGVMSNPELAPMTASVRSIWLYIHVFFAWLAFGAFTIAFGLGVIYLLKEKNPESDFYDKFPALPRLDDLMFKYLVFGFVTDAAMIASGSLWAKDLWGNYWSWDPVEMWSLVTWLTYGLAIHLKLTMGWKGRRLAWIVIFALSGMVISYFGIDIFVKSSLHAFEAWQVI